MPMIEVDETEFLNSKKVVQTVQNLLKNPAARLKVLEAQKLVNPDTPIAEIDMMKPVQDAIGEMRKTVDDFISAQTKKQNDDEAARKAADFATKFNAGKAALIERGYTDEGIAKIEALMTAKGIIDHDDAVTIFERDNPPPSIAPPSGLSAFDVLSPQTSGEDDVMKKLMETRGEDDGLLHKMVNSALAEVRAPQQRRR